MDTLKKNASLYGVRRFDMRWICLFVFPLLIVACGTDNNIPPQKPPTEVTVTGKVQKGHFNQLFVNVYPVEENGEFSQPFAAQINGSEYSFDAPAGQVVNVRAHGTYIDEVSGNERTITEDAPLETVFGVSSQSQNINILTTITTSTWKTGGDLSLSAHTLKETEVSAALGFDNADFGSLDITNVVSPNDPNFMLLVLGGGLLKQDPGLQGIPSGLSEIINLLDDNVPLALALNRLHGLDIGAIYNDIRTGGFIANLPELPIDDGSIFLCEPVCGLIPALGPVVTVNGAVIYEGQGTSDIRLHRTGNLASELTVDYTVTEGSAGENIDFAIPSSTTTFAAGSDTATINIAPIIDNLAEEDETLTISFSLPADAGISLRSSITEIVIKDGLPAAAALPELSNLTTSGCFVDIGVASEILPVDSELLCADSVDTGKAIDESTQASLLFIPNIDNDCTNNVCNSSAVWPFTVFLESVNNEGMVVGSEPLGDLLFKPASLLDTASENTPWLANVPPETLNQLLGDAVANGYAIQIRLLSPESSSANVVAEAISLPALAPAGEIQFGDIPFEIIAGASITASDTCPSDGDLLVTGTFAQTVTLYGVEVEVAYTGDACAAYTQSESGGGWQVTQSDIDLSGESIPLPDGVYSFIEVDTGVAPAQRSVGAFPLVILGNSNAANGYSLSSLLTTDELPFALRVSGAALTQHGIQLSISGSVLIDQPEFYPGDPRSASSASNTNMYGNIAAGNVTITANGLQGNLTGNAGSGETSFPKGTLQWQSFDLALLNGQLQDHSVSVSYSLEQNLDCSSLTCSQGNSQRHSVSGTLNVDAQGTAIGATQYSQSSLLAWGALASGNAFELQNALTSGTQATIVLPGFIQRYVANTSENAADGLSSHRRQGAFVHSIFGPESDEYILGNFFAAGITVGPELYSNGSGQPEELSGSSLDNLNFVIKGAGFAAQTVTSHAATKFVIQNAGVSGVVNADPAGLPASLSLADFAFTLDRFALRTQENTNDSFNWVDGSLRLEGDAKIGMQFTNLEMGCDGSLGDAQMLSEACDGDCKLDSWRANIDIFKFAFTSPSGESLACSTDAPALSLDHDIEFKALDKAIAMNTKWNSQGELLSSASHDQTQYIFDSRASKQGYPVVVDSVTLNSPLDVTEPETQRYGTLVLSADIGMPFWLPLEADIRLANTTSFGSPVAEPSVVVPRAAFASADFQNIKTALNMNVQQLISEDDQFDFNARYEWGNTGFGFQLPVYYESKLAHQDVSFLGRRKELDLFVLSAGAGIDYIQPDRTKLSFGASADFAALKTVRFQIDLTDLDGLAKVDELLINAKIIQEPVITPTLETISNSVSIVNDVAGRGLDPLMEKLLLEAVTNVGKAAIPAMPNQKDPFDTLADTMAEIKNLPNHLIAQTDQRVFAPIQQLLQAQESALKAELIELVVEIEAVAPGAPIQQALKEKITTVYGLLNTANQQINGVFEPVETGITNIVTQIKQVDDAVTQAAYAKEEIEAVFNEVTSVVSSQCAVEGSVIGSESAGYLQAPFQQLNDVKALVQLLSNSEALGTLADLVVDDPKVKETIADTQENLREGATALLAKVSEAEIAIRNTLCQSDVTNLLTQVDALLLQVDNSISQMQQVVTTIDTEMALVAAIVSNTKQTIIGPLGQVTVLVNDIERSLNERLATANGTEVINQLNQILATNSGAAGLPINVIVARQSGEVDVFDYAFDAVSNSVESARNQFVAELKRQTQDLFPYGDMSADQLRRQLVTAVLSSDPVTGIREELNTNMVEILRKANDQILTITDQANTLVQNALAKVENQANKILEQATAPVRDIPLDSARLDGFGVIAGNELERAHVGAEWTMSSSDESEPGNTFGAALDAVSWSASGKAEGCAGPGADSNLDVTISAMGIPAKIGPAEITIKKVYLGFTLGSESPEFSFTPIGVNGGISTSGKIDFTEFMIYDPAFAAGIGVHEVYLGAAAGAVFSAIQAEVAFLVGKTCNQDILMELDPNVAQYIPLPDTGFTGAYVRGAASIPVYSNGCPLTIGAAADIGAWILKGPPLTLGGLVGGGAYGKVGCVGALRGQIRAIGQVNTDGDMTFIGEGFGVAGLGLCEPASWTTVERSRQDGLCGTADALFTAGYKNGWSVFNMSVSAIH